MLTSWITFIKAHERMFLVLAGLAVAGWLFNKYENYSHDEAVGKNAIAQQQLAAQIEQNKQLVEQFVTMKADYDKKEAAWRAQEITLLASIASRNQQTTNQQHVDETLPLVELAKRWALLIQTAPTEIQVVNGGLSVSEQASRTTVKELEEVVPLKATVVDQTTLLNNKDAQITGLAGLNTSLTAQVTGLNKQLTDQQKVCDTNLALVKNNARRSKRNWFIGGVVTGAGLAVKFILF